MEIVKKIKYFLILLTVFAIPLAFNPYLGDIFNSTKGIGLLLLTSVLLFLWGVECFLQKKLSFRLSWVNSLVGVLFAISLLNLIANTPLVSSWFGEGSITGITTTIFGLYGTLGTGFLTIMALIVFYFVAINTLDSEKKINNFIRFISASGAISVLLSLVRFVLPNIDLGNSPFNMIFKGYSIINPSFPTLYPYQNFSTLGEYYLLPVFALIGIVLELYLINSSVHGRKSVKYLDSVILFILAIGYIFTSAMTIYSYDSFSIFPAAYYIIGFIVVLFLFYKNIKSDGLFKPMRKSLYTSYGITGVGAVVGLIGLLISKSTQIASPLIPLGASWPTSFAALGSSLKNGFLGIGAENYSVTYLKNKPVGINSTNLLFETVNHAGNFILDIIATYGLLGLAAFIFITVKILVYIIKNKSTKEPLEQAVFTALLVSFLFFFLFPVNLTMMFVVFTLLILLSALNYKELNNTKNLVILFKNINPVGSFFTTKTVEEKSIDKNAAATLFFSFTVIIFIAGVIFSYNLFSAQYHYAKSFRDPANLTEDKEIDKALLQLNSGIQSFGYADNFYNRYAGLTYQKLNNAANRANERIKAENKDKKTTDTTQPTLTTAEQNEIQTYFNAMSSSLDKAVQVNPLNYENYYLASRIYFELAKNNKSQYLQTALDNLNIAIRLNPQNPTLYLLLGNIYILNNDAGNARNALATSIQKYPTLDAFAQLAQLYKDVKQYDASLDTLKQAQQLVEKDGETYKQIGEAIKQVEDAKKNDPSPTATPTPTPAPTVTPTPKKK